MKKLIALNDTHNILSCFKSHISNSSLDTSKRSITNIDNKSILYKKVEEYVYDKVGGKIGNLSLLITPANENLPWHRDYRNVASFPKINWVIGGGEIVLNNKLIPDSNEKFKTSNNLPYDDYSNILSIPTITEYLDSRTNTNHFMFDSAYPHCVTNISSTRFTLSLTPRIRLARLYAFDELLIKLNDSSF